MGNYIIHSFNQAKTANYGVYYLLLLQFYALYLFGLGVSLLGIWILNIALYASVKQRPSLAEIGRNNSRYVPTNSFQGNIRNKGPVGRKLQTIWKTLLTFRKRFSTANVQENSVVTKRTSHEQSCRKQLELSLAKTVRYVIVAFTLALLPCIIVVGTAGLNSLDPSDLNFRPLSIAAWNGSAYLAVRILFSNSFVNCIIYSYRNKNFRTGLKNSFICFFKKK